MNEDISSENRLPCGRIATAIGSRFMEFGQDKLSYIGADLWKVKLTYYYENKDDDTLSRVEKATEYVLANSMESAIETAKSECQLTIDVDNQPNSKWWVSVVYINSVRNLCSAVLVSKHVAEDIAEYFEGDE